MELSFFELSQARTWAMGVLNMCSDMRVLLDVGGVDGAG